MSLGFKKLRGLLAGLVPNPPSEPSGEVLPADKGTPSTTYSGSLFEVTDVVPRIRNAIPAPGSPLDETVFTPATLP